MTPLELADLQSSCPRATTPRPDPGPEWNDPTEPVSPEQTTDRLRRFVADHAMAARRGGRLRTLVTRPAPTVIRHDPGHRNWLPEEAFDLPRSRFGDGCGTVGLVAAVHAAVRDTTSRAETVVRPVGSVSYLRRHDGVLWDLVRDVDLWCYVPSEVFERNELPAVTEQVTAALQRRLCEAGLRCRRNLRRTLLLGGRGHRTRALEVKLAPITWLSEGLDRLGDRELTLRRPRTAAYALAPRPEWAAYVGHENHFPTPAAAEQFDRLLATIPPAERFRCVELTYRDNVAIALGQCLRARARWPLRRRLFVAHMSKALKIVALLAVIRRDHVLRAAALGQLERLVARDTDLGSHETRLAYIAALALNLEALRHVEPELLMDAACPGGWSGIEQP